MEIALTKGKVALVDEEDFEHLEEFKWYATTKGYAVRDVHVEGKKVTIRMHRVVMNSPDSLQVDHINNDKLDNRKSNLRLCNNTQNQANKPPTKQNTSGYRGVTFHKLTNKWQAQIIFKGKKKSLGLYHNIKKAAAAYDKRAKELFGEFAYQNIK